MNVLRHFLNDPRRVAIALIFAVHGSTVGTLFSRIAELRLAMGLSEADLGLALVGLPCGVFIGSLIVSRVIERSGTRRSLLIALPFFSCALVLASLAVNTPTLFGTLFLFGFGLTSCNITMNVEADRVEAATGKRLINRCHGTWGVGFLFASLVGTVAVAAGIPPTMHFLMMFVFLNLVTILLVGPLQESPPRAHKGDAGPRRRLALPTFSVLLVIAFACSGIVLEGSTRNWSVIYLRDDFTAIGWIATLALPAIVTAQITGRFLADTLIDRFGPVRVAMALSVVSFVGLGLVVAAWSVRGGARRVCADRLRHQHGPSAGSLGRGASRRPPGIRERCVVLNAADGPRFRGAAAFRVRRLALRNPRVFRDVPAHADHRTGLCALSRPAEGEAGHRRLKRSYT